MSFEDNAVALNELTIAQETASWDRQRTSEELKDFVSRRLAQIATAEEVEIVA
jgi:hypothetical protein